eukprot:TRINITY_DN22306_c0_g1_i2.p1 TRINITY_DN22306_c0_g1~~TRINITY_DN22306_c0_g1_i2.p1  ORF type:complete len:1118 (+),score=167.90 TRINITY_DN22306_c0_g1_i2:140-3493(+)
MPALRKQRGHVVLKPKRSVGTECGGFVEPSAPTVCGRQDACPLGRFDFGPLAPCEFRPRSVQLPLLYDTSSLSCSNGKLKVGGLSGTKRCCESLRSRPSRSCTPAREGSAHKLEYMFWLFDIDGDSRLSFAELSAFLSAVAQEQWEDFWQYGEWCKRFGMESDLGLDLPCFCELLSLERSFVDDAFRCLGLESFDAAGSNSCATMRAELVRQALKGGDAALASALTRCWRTDFVRLIANDLCRASSVGCRSHGVSFAARGGENGFAAGSSSTAADVAAAAAFAASWVACRVALEENGGVALAAMMSILHAADDFVESAFAAMQQCRDSFQEYLTRGAFDQHVQQWASFDATWGARIASFLARCQGADDERRQVNENGGPHARGELIWRYIQAVVKLAVSARYTGPDNIAAPPAAFAALLAASWQFQAFGVTVPTHVPGVTRRRDFAKSRPTTRLSSAARSKLQGVAAISEEDAVGGDGARGTVEAEKDEWGGGSRGREGEGIEAGVERGGVPLEVVGECSAVPTSQPNCQARSGIRVCELGAAVPVSVGSLRPKTAPSRLPTRASQQTHIAPHFDKQWRQAPGRRRPPLSAGAAPLEAAKVPPSPTLPPQGHAARGGSWRHREQLRGGNQNEHCHTREFDHESQRGIVVEPSVDQEQDALLDVDTISASSDVQGSCDVASTLAPASWPLLEEATVAADLDDETVKEINTLMLASVISLSGETSVIASPVVMADSQMDAAVANLPLVTKGIDSSFEVDDDAKVAKRPLQDMFKDLEAVCEEEEAQAGWAGALLKVADAVVREDEGAVAREEPQDVCEIRRTCSSAESGLVVTPELQSHSAASIGDVARPPTPPGTSVSFSSSWSGCSADREDSEGGGPARGYVAAAAFPTLAGVTPPEFGAEGGDDEDGGAIGQRRSTAAEGSFHERDLETEFEPRMTTVVDVVRIASQEGTSPSSSSNSDTSNSDRDQPVGRSSDADCEAATAAPAPPLGVLYLASPEADLTILSASSPPLENAAEPHEIGSPLSQDLPFESSSSAPESSERSGSSVESCVQLEHCGELESPAATRHTSETDVRGILTAPTHGVVASSAAEEGGLDEAVTEHLSANTSIEGHFCRQN